jgi:hypothetical protein
MAAHVVEQPWDRRHQRILQLTLKGKTIDSIATDKRVNLNHKTVKKVQDSLEFKQRYEVATRSMSDKAQEYLSKHAIAALRKIVRLSRKGTNAEKIQFEASKEVLYLMGIKPVDVIESRQRPANPLEVQSTQVTLTEIEETVDRLSKRDSTFIMKRGADNRIVEETSISEVETPLPIYSDATETIKTSPDRQEAQPA